MDIREQRRNMVAPTARLVQFLRELARTGRPQIRDVDGHQLVRWLVDLPPEVMPQTDAGPGDALFSINPVVSEPPPPLPAALEGWVDAGDAANSGLERPPLADGIPDDRRVRNAYKAWLERWEVWAEADRLVAERRDWYNALAGAARHVEQQDDIYELVVGAGLLTWTTPTGTIRHPLLTTRASIVTDSATGRLDVVVSEDAATTIADRALLEGQHEFDSQRVEAIREEIRSNPPQPLGDHNKDLLSRWRSLALQRAFPYDHTWDPTHPGDAGPDLRFAPVLLLRERDRTSLIDYFDRMLDALSGPDATAPLGLAQLLSALEPEERAAWLDDEGAVEGPALGDDPLFPLPTNPEQRQIIERMRHDNGVVVLGPPGTGKTHTIANLLSALLAKGQRVLVTSQKGQALRVLRDQLPSEIQKLCVSMTDVARGGSQELDESVTALSDRFSSFSPAHHHQQLARKTSARDAARQKVAEVTERIRALRESETYVHPPVAAGYAGTKARLAERLNQQAPRCDWMPLPLPEAAPFEPPLAVDELVELHRLLASSTPQRVARARQVLPDMTTIPTAVTVGALAHDEAAAVATARQVASDLSDALAPLSEDDLQALRASAEHVQGSLHELRLAGDPATWPEDDWRVQAIHNGFARRELGVWQQLAEVSRHAHTAQDWLGSIGLRSVTLPPFEDAGPDSMLGQLSAGRALRAHLAEGHQLKRRFRPAVQKRAARLLDGALVDGVPVGNLEQLECTMATLEAEHTAQVLSEHWATVGVHVDPSLPLARRVAQLVDLCDALEHVLAVAAWRDHTEDQLGAHGVRLPLGTTEDWLAFVGALEAAEARLRAERATAQLDQLVACLHIDAQSPTAAPELTQLAAAAAGRDARAYEQHLAQLAGAFAEQEEQRRCDDLWGRLHAAHPLLAELLRTTPDEPDWDQRLASFEAAWAWGRARTYFDGLRQPGLEDRLAAELEDAVERVGRTTAELAAEQAWGQCLLRMSAHQEQALRSYRANIDDRGKGTGRWAHRFAAAARQAMIEARDAVPAWIMPLRDVVETIPPDQNSFDVVIIDEASQASIESLFLLWLAPRVIVVGDERQCAPSQVIRGQLQPIFDRLDDYLADVPEYLRLAFTPKSNLFSLLATRFGSVIRLREHFRCMPEIIGWSSRQFYPDAPLVPLRQFGADRLTPLRTVHVSGAVTDSNAAKMRNPGEAEALVSKLVDCLEDPAYRDRTFGVVVLQGSGQAHLIERLLQQRVAPDEWEHRRLRVGTPPDFQGDERDVVFLSMVVAERPRAVTAREWQRRFNVAASRARDQLWLFHSVLLDLLSTADLRRSLLAYMLNPPSALTAGDFDDLRWDSEVRYPFESRFEQRVFIALRDRGFQVAPHVEVNGRRIDLVVTGARGQLAVECDGDYWHTRHEDQLADLDRERELRRAGWRFWRVRESEFNLDPETALQSLWRTLAERGIEPGQPVPLICDTAETWEATALSDEEGLDGLDGANPGDLDAKIGTPSRVDEFAKP